jgi:predicted dehydrogenase
MIRVGLIGANPDRGWAMVSHLPALQHLDRYELVAVATSREETAARAASAFGVSRSYSNAMALIEDPEVDLVVVTVKVPVHHQIVSAAVNAGKNILCEWPLGNGLAEAESLAELASQADSRQFIGLQARSSPQLAFIRDLVADGYVGDVLSSSVVASGFGWGAAIDPAQAYLFDVSCGATMLSVTGGHMLDAVRSCIGDVHDVRATIAQRRKEVAILDIEDVERYRRFTADLVTDGRSPDSAAPSVVSTEMRPSTVADQVALSGILDSGGILSVHIRGGQFRSTNFLWEINGTDGDLQIEGRAGTIQIQPLTIRGARGPNALVSDLPIPERYRIEETEGLTGPALNVANLYVDVAKDLADGGSRSPDFRTAVEVHRMLDGIEASAHGGRDGSPTGPGRRGPAVRLR